MRGLAISSFTARQRCTPLPPWSTLGNTRGAQRGAVADVKPVLPKKVVTNRYVRMVIPWLGKVSYGLLAAGFMMTDLVWLRCLLTSGYVGLTLFHIFQFRPLYIPMIGSFFFICANGYMGMNLYYERNMLLDEEERAIYNGHFKLIMPEQAFKKLLAHGKVVTAEAQFEVVEASGSDLVFDEIGEELITEGEIADLVLVLEGAVEVKLYNGRSTYVGPGALLGEISFLDGAEALATVLAVPGSKYAVWRQRELKEFLEQEPEIKKCLMLRIGQELIAKFVRGDLRIEQGASSYLNKDGQPAIVPVHAKEEASRMRWLVKRTPSFTRRRGDMPLTERPPSRTRYPLEAA